MKQLTTLMMFLILSSCGSLTTYRPSIYGHDFKTMEIVTPVTYERISCGEKEFNKYASIKLSDLSKLALILKNAKLPKKVRFIIERFKREVDKRAKENKELGE